MSQKPKKLKQLEQKLGISFSDQELWRRVFIHRSYLNEAPELDLEHNERLEFLGDAVLELIVTEYLYRNFSNAEGELTNWRSSIVRGDVLAKVASELSLGDYLFLSRGEEKSGGRSRHLILANTFEALIGALYLDKGYNPAREFVAQHLISLLPEIIEKQLHIDPKSKLQELSQEKLGKTPEYRVLEESGPDHAKVFVVGVYAGGQFLAKGNGPSKQRAEQTAAGVALDEWQR